MPIESLVMHRTALPQSPLQTRDNCQKKGPDPIDEAIERVHDAAQTLNGCSMRIYQTAAGLRCLITNQSFDPTSGDVADILHRFGSDPLYARLCKAQECFRARLTPKPWRCGIDHPPGRYPFRNDAHEATYRAWEDKYHNTISGYSTCRLRETIGEGRVHDELAAVVEEHDTYACFDESLPLA